MENDFEKLLLQKDQHLKQLLHPREEAHKHIEKQSRRSQFEDNAQD